MADLGYLRALLNGIQDDTTRRILLTAFEHVLTNIRIGAPDSHVRATNLQLYFQASTTASDTGEFSIAHGLPSAPHLAIPVLDLRQPGAKLAPLTVTRAADERRVYLKTDAGSTNVPMCVLVE